VWHSSAAAGIPWAPEALGRLARKELEGVGDPSAGEWEEWTGKAFHLRRRLTADEARTTGPVVDVRGTPEEAARLAPVAHFLPAWYSE